MEGTRKDEEIVRGELVKPFVEVALVDQAASLVEDHDREYNHGERWVCWEQEAMVGQGGGQVRWSESLCEGGYRVGVEHPDPSRDRHSFNYHHHLSNATPPPLQPDLLSLHDFALPAPLVSLDPSPTT